MSAIDEQLLKIGKSNLAPAALRSQEPIGSEAIDPQHFTDPLALKGAKFAAALKARATGVRSIVDNAAIATLPLADLKAGNQILAIRHRQPAADRDKLYYSSSLTNRSSERLRIERFGTYLLDGRTLVLSALTGGCYNSQQFREWYGVGEWIEPGQTAVDRSSHSNPGTYWIYFGTTASGQTFIAGAAWKHGWW